MSETPAGYYTDADADLRHNILTLLRRGPCMRSEIARYCRPHTSEEVDHALLRMKRNGTIRYLGAVGLYQLVDA